MNFHKKTIKDIEIKGKTVVVRAMLNVPIDDEDGTVADDSRLEAAKPTLDYLVENGAAAVLLSHHSSEGQSLAPVAPVLANVLGRDVKFINESIGPEVEAAVKDLRPGEILILENLRFHAEEEANDSAFARKLAAYGEVFVEDDFTTCHREHASVVGIPKSLPAVAGLQVELEVKTITQALKKPKRPLVAVTAGAKISTKLPIVSFLLDEVDAFFVGGAMANTFLLAQGKPVGKSLVEPHQVGTAKKVLARAKTQHKKVLLPIDVVVATKLDPPTDVRTVKVDDVREQDIIVDLGPETIHQLDEVIKSKGTVIWNGPIGIFETPEFAGGTKAVADKIISSGAYSLVGGGDTLDYIDDARLRSKFSFVSTGGGASMELMSGEKLPGVEALLNKE